MVRCIQTVYLDGKKYDRDSEAFEWPEDKRAAAVDLCERGYIELISDEPAEEAAKPKGKRGA